MEQQPAPPFQWPPRRADAATVNRAGVDLPRLTAPAAALPGWLARWRVAWAEIERTWLEPTAEPLDRRAEAAGWSPDDADAFCPRCGSRIGVFDADDFGCATCRDRRLPWNRLVRLGEYSEPLSQWICEVKFTRWGVLGQSLGRILARQVLRAGFSPLDAASAVVVPVPTTLRRRLVRGIDHAGVIAAAMAASLGLPVVRPLRRRHRPSQRAIPRSRRARNVSGAFSLARPGLVAGRTVLLVDDVMTTGATLRAASRAIHRGLKKAGSEPAKGLWACVLAVNDNRR